LAPQSGAAASARESASGLVFTLHGLSKLVAMPQLKLSWICVDGPDGLVEEALARLELIADAFLSVATPVQLAVPALLEHGAGLRAAIGTRLERNYAALGEACAGTPVTRLRAEGGWYAMLRLPALMDDEAWALSLLEEAEVRVQPGYFYDCEDGPLLVVSLLTPEHELERGIARILEHVQTHVDSA
jgi:aspartate/methionine/tyrosine aminotransferase